jgi:addiction module HigA family antidote
MTEMHNPPHPGRILRQALGDMTVTEAARRLHVSRVMLSRILNCSAGITAEMSLRLSALLGTHESLWYDMQRGYDMWQAKKRKLPRIERIRPAA